MEHQPSIASTAEAKGWGAIGTARLSWFKGSIQALTEGHGRPGCSRRPAAAPFLRSERSIARHQHASGRIGGLWANLLSRLPARRPLSSKMLLRFDAMPQPTSSGDRGGVASLQLGAGPERRSPARVRTLGASTSAMGGSLPSAALFLRGFGVVIGYSVPFCSSI